VNDRRDDIDPRELTGAYALNAVDDGERRAFEHEAAGSPSLQTEADELRATALLLALAAEPAAPSARMKTDLMAKIASTPQLPADRSTPLARRDSTPVPAPAPQATVEAPPVAPQASTRAETKARSRWFTGPVGLLAGAAAAAALFVGGGFVGSSLTDGPAAPVVIDASATDLAEITAASDSQRSSVELADGGSATLVWSEQLGRSAVLTDGLPSLPDDSVYEAWYIDAEGAVPAGTFTAGGSGTAWHVLEGTMAAGATVGVTVEPAGGSRTPTTDPVIVVESA
jgi:anti-sigma-K factor RskA